MMQLTNSNSREPTIETTLYDSKEQGIERKGREIPGLCSKLDEGMGDVHGTSQRGSVPCKNTNSAPRGRSLRPIKSWEGNSNSFSF